MLLFLSLSLRPSLFFISPLPLLLRFYLPCLPFLPFPPLPLPPSFALLLLINLPSLFPVKIGSKREARVQKRRFEWIFDKTIPKGVQIYFIAERIDQKHTGDLGGLFQPTKSYSWY